MVGGNMVTQKRRDHATRPGVAAIDDVPAYATQLPANYSRHAH